MRFAADCWDKKASRLFAQGKEEEAGKCWDAAIACREEANRKEEGRRSDGGLR